MVPITRGRFRVKLTARGMSTQTCWEARSQLHGRYWQALHLFMNQKVCRLTMSEYSTWMMLQSKMEGDIGGILSILPSQVSVLPDGRGSPRRLATSCLISLTFPLAKKVWVWQMAAFGTTTREEQFSISAKIWMDSPAKKTNQINSL